MKTLQVGLKCLHYMFDVNALTSLIQHIYMNSLTHKVDLNVYITSLKSNVYITSLTQIYTWTWMER